MLFIGASRGSGTPGKLLRVVFRPCQTAFLITNPSYARKRARSLSNTQELRRFSLHKQKELRNLSRCP